MLPRRPRHVTCSPSVLRPDLLSISILGRNIVFSNDTLTAANQGAVRAIGGFGTNFVTIAQEDQNDQGVPELATPHVGDTFTLDVQRQGAQDIQRTGVPPVDVVILPPPPAFVPNANQVLNNKGDVNVSTGQQPDLHRHVGRAHGDGCRCFRGNQASAVGLPTNVNVP